MYGNLFVAKRQREEKIRMEIRMKMQCKNSYGIVIKSCIKSFKGSQKGEMLPYSIWSYSKF